jgi:hypothetical protein
LKSSPKVRIDFPREMLIAVPASPQKRRFSSTIT